jgi:hypothetical protein
MSKVNMLLVALVLVLVGCSGPVSRSGKAAANAPTGSVSSYSTDAIKCVMYEVTAYANGDTVYFNNKIFVKGSTKELGFEMAEKTAIAKYNEKVDSISVVKHNIDIVR